MKRGTRRRNMEKQNDHIRFRKATHEAHGLQSRSTLAQSEEPNDIFPAPVQLGLNKIGWPEEDVEAWEQSLSRVNYAPNTLSQAAA